MQGLFDPVSGASARANIVDCRYRCVVYKHDATTILATEYKQPQLFAPAFSAINYLKLELEKFCRVGKTWT